MKRTLLSALIATGLLGFASNVQAEKARAFYGDPTHHRVVAIDIPNMKELGQIDTQSTPYPVDRAGKLDKIYAITRGAYSVDIIDAKTLENKGLIHLDHKPRSGEAYNASLDLVLIAGADKPLSSLISPSEDAVVATAGLDEVTTPNGDYGGGNASGHPSWLTDTRFVVIDRANRTIHVYEVQPDYSVQLLSSLETPTTVHHFVSRDLSGVTGRDKRVYYAVGEGAPARGIPPQLYKLKLKKNGKLQLKRTLDLQKDGVDVASMGSHHADMHPDGRHIYMGSNEGTMYVIDRKRMSIVSRIPTDAGTGHTRFVPAKNMAVVTNHKGRSLTIIDSSTHQKIKDVRVSRSYFDGTITQSHTNYVDENARHYYAFATADGEFYKLNLNRLKVKKRLHTGGTPRQGVFIPKGN